MRHLLRWQTIIPILLLSYLIVHDLHANQSRHLKHYQKQFIDFMRPNIQKANSELLQEREKLNQIAQRFDALFLKLKNNAMHPLPLTRKEHVFLNHLAQKYHVKWGLSETRTNRLFRSLDWLTLKKRVDIIPENLILAQAINESNWGRSRFTREGNNYFGQWCFKKGCGLIPKGRAQGEKFEVKRFDSVLTSIKSYLLILNTKPYYKGLREKRWELRKQHRPLTAFALVGGLKRYSARGQDYVSALKKNHSTVGTAFLK